MMDTIQTITANLDTGAIVTKSWAGRNWLVAPVVPVVAGVLNEELVSAEELGSGYQSWNGRPVTVGHPQQDGAFISANSPDVLDQYQVGQLFNVRFDGNRLKADAWLDVARLQTVNNDLLNDLQSGKPVEVSTGYYRRVYREQGVAGGRRYRTVAVDIKPDHLALLPGAVGACSWDDGCGIPRTNAETEVDMPAIGKHSTGTTDAAWDGAANEARLKTNQDSDYYGQMYAWRDPDKDASTKAAYKLPHHEVSEDGTPGDANIKACQAAIAALNGARGGVDIPDSDKDAVYNHLAAHLEDADVEAPELASEQANDAPGAELGIMRRLLERIADSLFNETQTETKEEEIMPEEVTVNEEPQPQPCDEAKELLEWAEAHGGYDTTLAVLQEREQAEQKERDDLTAQIAKSDKFEADDLTDIPLATLRKMADAMTEPVANYAGVPGVAETLAEDTVVDLPPLMG